MSDMTVLMMAAVQAVLTDTYPSLERAVRDPRDEDDRRILESWTGIQTLLGERFGRERDDGTMTEEQYDYAIDWLVNWIENGPEESRALLDGWLEWAERRVEV